MWARAGLAAVLIWVLGGTVPVAGDGKMLAVFYSSLGFIKFESEKCFATHSECIFIINPAKYEKTPGLVNDRSLSDTPNQLVNINWMVNFLAGSYVKPALDLFFGGVSILWRSSEVDHIARANDHFVSWALPCIPNCHSDGRAGGIRSPDSGFDHANVAPDLSFPYPPRFEQRIPNVDDASNRGEQGYKGNHQDTERPISHRLLSGKVIFGALGFLLGAYFFLYAFSDRRNVSADTLALYVRRAAFCTILTRR